MSLLTTEQTALELGKIPGWTHHAETITRTFKFNNFPLSVAFVHRLAACAEKIQHHPDIDIRYDEVTLTLTTHDAGGLTEKDFTLARQSDVIYAGFIEPGTEPIPAKKYESQKSPYGSSHPESAGGTLEPLRLR
jgi:4a-hydroxytetrahydrobiopterin dehydratase